MNIHEKHTAYKKLKTTNKETIQRDIELLEQRNPKSQSLLVSDTDIERKGQEVLWDLLDVATIDEVKKARESKPSGETVELKKAEDVSKDDKPTPVVEHKKKARRKSTRTSAGSKTNAKRSKKQ